MAINMSQCVPQPLQKTAEEIGDDRDWRTRNPGSAGPPAARSGDRDRDFDRDFSRETRDAPTSSSAPAERDTSAAAPAAKDVREQGEIREQRQSKLPTQQPASQPRAPVQQQQPSAQQQQAMAQPQSSGSSEQVSIPQGFWASVFSQSVIALTCSLRVSFGALFGSTPAHGGTCLKVLW